METLWLRQATGRSRWRRRAQGHDSHYKHPAEESGAHGGASTQKQASNPFTGTLVKRSGRSQGLGTGVSTVDSMEKSPLVVLPDGVTAPVDRFLDVPDGQLVSSFECEHPCRHG